MKEIIANLIEPHVVQHIKQFLRVVSVNYESKQMCNSHEIIIDLQA